jgi:hypothetical protein
MNIYVKIVLLFLLTSCRNNSNTQFVKVWNERKAEAFRECSTKDSLINLSLLDSTCSCKNVVQDREGFCDSLTNLLVHKK